MFKLDMGGPVARLTLDRGQARNAIPIHGWAELADLAETAQGSGAGALIVRSAGGAFCAGADLAEFESFQNDRQAGTDFREKMRSGLERLRALPIPTIALIEGACYGAGVALAMACDLRFAGTGAQFAITPAKLGISFPQEDVHRLVALVGPGQAALLLLGAAVIDGREAERIGLVESWHGKGAGDAAERFAATLAANDKESLAALKRGIALAADGVVMDAAQDQGFDALLGRDILFKRLAERRRSR